MIKVTRLRIGDDLSAAEELLRRFFAEEGFDGAVASISENTRRLSALDICGLFLAEENSAALGVATVSLDFGIEFGWSGEIGDIYVLPEHRGKGVSRLLVEAATALAIAKGSTALQVTVTANAAAQHDLRTYYGKLGFTDEGRVILAKAL